MKKIENDEQYEKARGWLIQTAANIEDPLSDLNQEEKEKALRIYDMTSAAVQSYRRGELAEQFPGLRKVYAELGWPINDPPATEEKQPEPQTEPAQENTVNLSDWLDD